MHLFSSWRDPAAIPSASHLTHAAKMSPPLRPLVLHPTTTLFPPPLPPLTADVWPQRGAFLLTAVGSGVRHQPGVRLSCRRPHRVAATARPFSRLQGRRPQQTPASRSASEARSRFPLLLSGFSCRCLRMSPHALWLRDVVPALRLERGVGHGGSLNLKECVPTRVRSWRARNEPL